VVGWLDNAANGYLVNDTLVLSVEITVEREDRFQCLDTGALLSGFARVSGVYMPC
jgi:hypothetical protein